MTIDSCRDPNFLPQSAPPAKCEIDERVDYTVRGCANPRCGKETRHYITWQNKDWCEECIKTAQLEAFGEAVRPCCQKEVGG